MAKTAVKTRPTPRKAAAQKFIYDFQEGERICAPF